MHERNAQMVGINWNYVLFTCAWHENSEPDKASGQLIKARITEVPL